MSTQLAILEAEALKPSPEGRVLLADHVLGSLRAKRFREDFSCCGSMIPDSELGHNTDLTKGIT